MIVCEQRQKLNVSKYNRNNVRYHFSGRRQFKKSLHFFHSSHFYHLTNYFGWFSLIFKRSTPTFTIFTFFFLFFCVNESIKIKVVVPVLIRWKSSIDRDHLSISKANNALSVKTQDTVIKWIYSIRICDKKCVCVGDEEPKLKLNWLVFITIFFKKIL